MTASATLSQHFTQTDPTPLGAGSAYEQPYAYGMNNPLVYVDPTGLRASGGVPNELALKNPIRPCAPSGYPEHDAAQRAWALARGALVDQSTPGRGLCMDVYKPSTGEIWEIKSASTLGIKVEVLGAQAQVDGYVADTPGSQTGGDHGAVVVPWFGGELVAQSYPLAVGPKTGLVFWRTRTGRRVPDPRPVPAPPVILVPERRPRPDPRPVPRPVPQPALSLFDDSMVL